MDSTFFRWLIVCLYAVIPSVFAADTLVTQTLDNGLRVVVLVEKRAPIAMQLLCYEVGSMDEMPGKTGLSHMLEHLMFKGTPLAPGDRFSRKIHEAGGVENAYTTHDYTAYHQLFAKQHLPMMMQFEADRMRNLVLSDNDFTQENKVVRDERLRSEDDPEDMFLEQFSQKAYGTHPYANPIIGWMKDLVSLNRADAENWYRRWYAPNHAILIVAGDVEPAQVFDLARQYYGVYLPDRTQTRRLDRQVRVFQNEQSFDYRHPQVELPSTAMAFAVPSLSDIDKDDDVYALAILSAVLDDDAASRLEKALVRDQKIAIRVWASYHYFRRGPTLFVMGGTPAEGVSNAQLQAAIRREIDRIIQEGVTEAELSRIKANLIAFQQYQRDALSSRANQIAQLVMIGLPADSLDTILERLQKVKAAEVSAVAQRYLTQPALIGNLLPIDKQTAH